MQEVSQHSKVVGSTGISWNCAGVIPLLLTVALWLAPPPLSRAVSEPEEEEFPPPDVTETIKDRVLRDILYGSDDFFGEDTDLSYADGVMPSGQMEVLPTVGGELSQETTTGGTSRRRTDAASGGAEGGTGGGGTGGGGGTVEPPPDEPPGGGEEPPPI